jgi:hypothetical protein
MTRYSRCPYPRVLLTASLFVLTVALIGCSSGESSPSANAQPAAPETGAPAAQKPGTAASTPVDACTLLTKADVEGLAGKSVAAGRKEDAGPLSTCAFDDPTAPQVGGRGTSQVLTLAVMTGEAGAYYKGATSQAKDSLEIARKNSASDEPVTGLGEVAYWDKILRNLNVASGRYYVTIEVESRNDGLAVAKGAATKVLAKLPR